MRKVSYNFYLKVLKQRNHSLKRDNYLYHVDCDGRLFRCPIAWLHKCCEEWEVLNVRFTETKLPWSYPKEDEK